MICLNIFALSPGSSKDKIIVQTYIISKICIDYFYFNIVDIFLKCSCSNFFIILEIQLIEDDSILGPSGNDTKTSKVRLERLGPVRLGYCWSRFFQLHLKDSLKKCLTACR